MKRIYLYLRKLYKRWDRKLTLSKRQQFVVVTGVLTTGLLLTQLVSIDLRYPMVFLLALIAYVLSAFALRDDLGGQEWYTLLILPTLFTAAIALFYFLLPVRWLTRLPVAALYAFGMYALLLTENIYNVAANRTIGLLRAAHTVGFLITLVTFFFLIQTVLAFRFFGIINSAFIGVIGFLLVLQSLWAIELDEKVSGRVLGISASIAVILAELTWVFSFWPVKSTVLALFLVAVFYSLGSMAQQFLAEKLYKKTVIEFFTVFALVFMVTLLATHWRGNF